MARNRVTDKTRRLRPDRLEQYARDADRATRDASAPKPPEVAVSVGFADEEGSASTRPTVPPPAAAPDTVTPDAVPVLHVTPGDAAWFDLHLEIQLILSAADGRTNAAQIADKLAIPSERVVATLARLVTQGLVKLK